MRTRREIYHTIPHLSPCSEHYAASFDKLSLNSTSFRLAHHLCLTVTLGSCLRTAMDTVQCLSNTRDGSFLPLFRNSRVPNYPQEFRSATRLLLCFPHSSYLTCYNSSMPDVICTGLHYILCAQNTRRRLGQCRSNAANRQRKLVQHSDRQATEEHATCGDVHPPRHLHWSRNHSVLCHVTTQDHPKCSQRSTSARR